MKFDALRIEWDMSADQVPNLYGIIDKNKGCRVHQFRGDVQVFLVLQKAYLMQKKSQLLLK